MKVNELQIPLHVSINHDYKIPNTATPILHPLSRLIDNVRYRLEIEISFFKFLSIRNIKLSIRCPFSASSLEMTPIVTGTGQMECSEKSNVHVYIDRTF